MVYFLGTATDAIGLLGGVIAARPEGILPLTSSPTGTSTVALPVPGVASLVGFHLYSQIAVIDTTAPQSVGFSNALAVTVCP